MTTFRKQYAFTAHACLWCLSILIKYEVSYCQEAQVMTNIQFPDLTNIPKGTREVARQNTGCLWLEGMANNMDYRWYIQPMPISKLVVKIVSITGGNMVWSTLADGTTNSMGGTLEAYSCSPVTAGDIENYCMPSSRQSLPLKNGADGTSIPAEGSYFESPSGDITLIYKAGSSAQSGDVGNGFTAVWYSTSLCAEGEYLDLKRLQSECVPGGLHRRWTRPRTACSVEYSAGNPGLEGCDLAGFSECSKGAVHDNKCWTMLPKQSMA